MAMAIYDQPEFKISTKNLVRSTRHTPKPFFKFNGKTCDVLIADKVSDFRNCQLLLGKKLPGFVHSE